jgi:hypothetical protein
VGVSARRVCCFLFHSALLDLCIPLTSALGMSLGFLPLPLRLRDGQIAKVRFTREFEQLLADPFRLSFCGSSLRRSKTIQLRIGIGFDWRERA